MAERETIRNYRHSYFSVSNTEVFKRPIKQVTATEVIFEERVLIKYPIRANYISIRYHGVY